MTLLTAAAALAALMFAQAGAAPAGQAAVESEDLVVIAPTPEHVRSFVDQLSAESATGQLARWDRRICPGVIGASPAAAEFMLDRIAVRAYEVGLDVGEPGCRPNVLILATSESDELAEALRGTRAVGHHAQDGNTRGRAAYREFAASEKPVRWWHVTRTVGADGDSNASNQSMSVRYMGRLRRSTREDFSHVIIILDVARAAGTRLEATADYLAMVALAQIEPELDVSEYPSILNLYAPAQAGEQRPAGLTDWDRAYLRGLYGSTSDARNARQQQREIERRMRRGR